MTSPFDWKNKPAEVKIPAKGKNGGKGWMEPINKLPPISKKARVTDDQDPRRKKHGN